MGNVPQAKKQLDPDQMPSPVRFIKIKRKKRSTFVIKEEKGTNIPTFISDPSYTRRQKFEGR